MKRSAPSKRDLPIWIHKAAARDGAGSVTTDCWSRQRTSHQGSPLSPNSRFDRFRTTTTIDCIHQRNCRNCDADFIYYDALQKRRQKRRRQL